MIVGKGMEILKRDFSSDRIEIHGFVESLSSYYEKATVVIAPILSGGGDENENSRSTHVWKESDWH